MGKARQIAVFDFDGTITSKDSFIEFIAFVFGWRKMAMGFLPYLPVLALMKLGLYPNGKAKQQIFSRFFKGMDYGSFLGYCNSFAERIAQFTRQNVLETIIHQQQKGAKTYVISASIEEWVSPFCQRIGIDNVLATKVEIDSKGCLTGRFSTKNCFGKEKVRRLLEMEPDRESYHLFACGDSKGDYPILEMADESILISHRQ